MAVRKFCSSVRPDRVRRTCQSLMKGQFCSFAVLQFCSLREKFLEFKFRRRNVKKSCSRDSSAVMQFSSFAV
jgi:hypothetical protein